MAAPDTGPAPPPVEEAATPARKYIGGIKGLLLIAVIFPAIFWLGFGVIDGFAIGMTAFLVLLGAAVEYLPGITEREAERQRLARESGNPDPVRQTRWYDGLAVLWLLAIPFGPALSWMVNNWFGVDRTNYALMLQGTAFVCVVIPVLGALSMLRFMKRGNWPVVLGIIAVGTAFPVAMGWSAAVDVVRGPQWQDVVITDLVDVNYTTSVGTVMENEAVYFVLADGRRLTHDAAVGPRLGPARLLVLRSYGHVIDAEPRNVVPPGFVPVE